MKGIHAIIFILAGICYCLKNILDYSPLFVNLLNDFIALPFVLALLLISMRFIYKERFQFSLLHALSAVLVASVLFEFILPMKNTAMTSDYFDIVLYLTGAGTYSFLYRILAPKVYS